jgi:hypothetical protein
LGGGSSSLTESSEPGRAHSEPELELIKHKVEKYLGPEIVEAKAATLKAMKEAEVGWQRAIDKIAQRAGFVKGADGTWSHPSMSEAA